MGLTFILTLITNKFECSSKLWYNFIKFFENYYYNLFSSEIFKPRTINIRFVKVYKTAFKCIISAVKKKKWRWKLKIDSELVGKEVIDASGDQVGIFKDVEWDFESKRVESIELEEAGISSKIGLGEKKVIPIKMVDQIGDKVLIKGRLLK